MEGVAIEMSEKKKHVKFIYNVDENYRTVYVNGVYGGITPRGDIHCSFFIEYNAIPEEEAFEVSEGKLGKKLDQPKEFTLLNRDLRVGLFLKADDAESIANWLLDKVRILRGEKTEQ